MVDSCIFLWSCDAVLWVLLHIVKSFVYSLTFLASPLCSWGRKAVKQGHYAECEMHLHYELIVIAIVDVTVMTVSMVAMKLVFMTLMRHKEPSEPLCIWCFWKYTLSGNVTAFNLTTVFRKNNKMNEQMIATPCKYNDGALMVCWKASLWLLPSSFLVIKCRSNMQKDEHGFENIYDHVHCTLMSMHI